MHIHMRVVWVDHVLTSATRAAPHVGAMVLHVRLWAQERRCQIANAYHWGLGRSCTGVVFSSTHVALLLVMLLTQYFSLARARILNCFEKPDAVLGIKSDRGSRDGLAPRDQSHFLDWRLRHDLIIAVTAVNLWRELAEGDRWHGLTRLAFDRRHLILLTKNW